MRERLTLVATNPMRIAGFQGVYGDPCGIELIPVSLSEALCLNHGQVVLIDAGSVTPLFEVLGRFTRKSSQVQIVVIGIEADDTYVECLLDAGAKGFLSATAIADEFGMALESVRDGFLWAPRKVLSRIIGRQAEARATSRSSEAGDVVLTPRETEVLRLLLGGQGNREIGANLGIDASTVKSHLGRMMRKAGVDNRVALTMYALHRRHVRAQAASEAEVSSR